ESPRAARPHARPAPDVFRDDVELSLRLLRGRVSPRAGLLSLLRLAAGTRLLRRIFRSSHPVPRHQPTALHLRRLGAANMAWAAEQPGALSDLDYRRDERCRQRRRRAQARICRDAEDAAGAPIAASHLVATRHHGTVGRGIGVRARTGGARDDERELGYLR